MRWWTEGGPKVDRRRREGGAVEGCGGKVEGRRVEGGGWWLEGTRKEAIKSCIIHNLTLCFINLSVIPLFWVDYEL